MEESKELVIDLGNAEVEFGDYVHDDETICIDVYTSQAPSCYFYINKEHAEKIIEHLQLVFKLDT